MENKTENQAKSQQTISGDVNSQSVFVKDPGIVKVYPKTMSPEEIGYDIHTNVKGGQPDDFYVNVLPHQSLVSTLKSAAPLLKSYLQNGEAAMKLLATRPDIALGITKPTDEEAQTAVLTTYKPWLDLWREAHPSLARKTEAFASEHPIAGFLPWLLTEYAPSELVSAGTKPSNWVGSYGIEKFGPAIANKIIQKLPQGAREVLLKNIWTAEEGLSDAFKTLGIKENVPTSQVIQAYRSKVMTAHPDMGGSSQEFNKVKSAYDSIMESRQGIINKFINKFRSIDAGEDLGLPYYDPAEAGRLLVPFGEDDLVRVGSEVGKIVKTATNLETSNTVGVMIKGTIKQVPMDQLNPVPKVQTLKDMQVERDKAAQAGDKENLEMWNKAIQDYKSQRGSLLIPKISSKDSIRVYHGTSPENKSKILKEGFSLDFSKLKNSAIRGIYTYPKKSHLLSGEFYNEEGGKGIVTAQTNFGKDKLFDLSNPKQMLEFFKNDKKFKEDISNIVYTDKDQYQWDIMESAFDRLPKTSDKLVKYLQSHGFRGIKYKVDEGLYEYVDHLVVFNPEDLSPIKENNRGSILIPGQDNPRPLTRKDFNQEKSPLPEDQILIKQEVIDKANELQNKLKKNLVVSSGYRTEEYNKDLIKRGFKADPNSVHKTGNAFDIDFKKSGLTQQQVVEAAKDLGFNIEDISLTPKHVHLELPTEGSPTKLMSFGNPPKVPPTETAVSGSPAPDEEPGKSAVNKENLQITPEGKENLEKATKMISDEIENQSGKTLSHGEVLEKAKEADILTKGVSRENTLKFEAMLLKTRQHLAALAEQKEVTPEFLETLRIVADTGTDIARQLESFKIDALPEYATIKTKIIKDIMKLGTSAEDILREAKGVDFTNQEQVADFYRKFVKPSLPDQLNEFAYMNILSSPKTHIVNAFSNLLQMAGLNPLTRLYSGALDIIGSNLTGKARQHYISEVPAFYKGVTNALPEAFNNMTDVLTGNRIVERPDVKSIPTKAKWIDVATLGVGKYVPRALEASDIFFRTLIEKGEVEALAEREGGINEKNIASINKEAKRRAEYYVFRQKPDPQNKTGQGSFLSGVDQLTNAVYKFRNVPGARWFIRFVQTPMNILKQGVEYSPLGLSTIKGAKDKTEQLAKSLVGFTVFAVGSYLALNKRTTWAVPTSKKDKELFYAAGMQPYSVKIGNEWISYSKLGPLAYPLAMSAALHYYEQEGPNALSDTAMEKGMKALTGTMQFFGDQSYVQSLGDFVKALRGDTSSITRFTTSVPTQLIPLSSLQGWVNDLIDPLYRTQATGLSAESISDHLKKKIVGLTFSMDPQKDIFNKPSEKPNRLLNSFSPSQVRKSNPAREKVYEAQIKSKQIKNKIDKQNENIKRRLK